VTPNCQKKFGSGFRVILLPCHPYAEAILAAEGGCEMSVESIGRLRGEQPPAFVRMFTESNNQSAPAHVVIQINSRVEILAAKPSMSHPTCTPLCDDA